jgi:hypothetical protein
MGEQDLGWRACGALGNADEGKTVSGFPYIGYFIRHP